MTEPTKPRIRRNEPAAPKGDGLKRAAAKVRTMAADSSTVKPYTYPIKPPKLMPGVAPQGVTPPVMAMDLNPYAFAAETYPGGGFPGFSYLSQLATRAEYRAFASTLSTEVTREWIEFTSKQDDDTDTAEKIKLIDEEFKRLNVRGVLQKAVEHDCYFGRAQIFIDIKDADRKTPLILDPRTVKKGSLNGVNTVEAIWTTPSGYNALDPAAPDFYKPNGWFMLGQQVHASRLMTTVTRPLPDMLKPAFNFAGMSLSQLAEPYVDNWLRTRQSVADLINNFSITVLATAMDQVLQGDDDGTDLFARADLFTATRSNRGLMLLDKEREELVQVNTPLSGLHELQAQSQEHMCSVSRTPAIVLTGISPSGLNASSDGEIRVFYDWIAAQQESFWREPLETILKVVQLSLFGEIDGDIGINFVPLYQMTPKELSEIRQADGATDCAYIAAGVVDASEVRERLAKDPNSGYDGLDTTVELIPPTEPTDETPPGGLEAADKSVSEAQHKAMEAAAHGKSTLGIPKKVGEEFVSKDNAGAT
jgi:phage-related protein (TIGR01555 family)